MVWDVILGRQEKPTAESTTTIVPPVVVVPVTPVIVPVVPVAPVLPESVAPVV